MMKKWILIGLFLALPACGGSGTPQYGTDVAGYQPADIWTVTVQGNGYPQDKIERMAMWRAAKVTLDRGADKFAIIGGDGISSRLEQTGNTNGAQIVTIQGAGPDTTVTTTPYAPAMRQFMTRAGGNFRIRIFTYDGAPVSSYDARQIMAAYGAEFAGVN